jgi:hypothetical protein
VPALQPCVIVPIWEQLTASPPERSTDHPLSFHRRRISDRVVFGKLVGLLRTLQPVGPEQLQSSIIEPHIQSHMLWVSEAVLYRTKHPPKLRSPVSL